MPRLIEALPELDYRTHHNIGQLSENQKSQIHAANITFDNLVNISDDALTQAYYDCTLMAFVSTSEGFDMLTIEAQAVGRPILISALSPISNVAGEVAVLVDPFNIDAIHAELTNRNYYHNCSEKQS